MSLARGGQNSCLLIVQLHSTIATAVRRIDRADERFIAGEEEGVHEEGEGEGEGEKRRPAESTTQLNQLCTHCDQVVQSGK